MCLVIANPTYLIRLRMYFGTWKEWLQKYFRIVTTYQIKLWCIFNVFYHTVIHRIFLFIFSGMFVIWTWLLSNTILTLEPVNLELQTTQLGCQSEWPKDKPFLLMHSRHFRNLYDSKIIFEIAWMLFEIILFIHFYQLK